MAGKGGGALFHDGRKSRAETPGEGLKVFIPGRFDQGASDHDSVRALRDLAGLARIPDSESGDDGEARALSDFGDVASQVRGHPLAGSRHALDHDVIDEAFGILEDGPGPSGGRRRRDERDERKSVAFHDRPVIRRFFERQVHDEQAVGARPGGVAAKGIEAAGEERIQVPEQDDRN